ncbi:MAG TPA: hypothetical protein VK641_10590 [Terriglobales bacterium]|nr:hypothetical protein [Terriglobales bacterium]
MPLLEKPGFHKIVRYPVRLLDAIEADILFDASVAIGQWLILSEKL